MVTDHHELTHDRRLTHHRRRFTHHQGASWGRDHVKGVAATGCSCLSSRPTPSTLLSGPSSVALSMVLMVIFSKGRTLGLMEVIGPLGPLVLLTEVCIHALRDGHLMARGLALFPGLESIAIGDARLCPTRRRTGHEATQK